MAKMIDINHVTEVSAAMQRLTEQFRNETPFFVAGALEVHSTIDTGLKHLGTIVLDFDPSSEEEGMYFRPAD